MALLGRRRGSGGAAATAYAGAGAGLDPGVVANWTGARLAEPAYDVAATLAFFWSSPLYVDNLAQRSVLKMARDSLASAYLAAYRRASGDAVDDARLDHWQAVHLQGLADDIARVIEAGPTGPWDRAGGVVRPEKALAEVQERVAELSPA